MTRFIHDQFAKDYLEELLSPFGECQAPLEIRSEIRQVDVFFTPKTSSQNAPEVLGLLGKLASNISLFEPFRNPVSINEIRTCVLKLLEVHTDYIRRANREKTKITEENYPKLWILTPTASSKILENIGAKNDGDNWGEGIYLLAPFLRTGLVVIHQLPETLDTLWLRMLGRGSVQQKAIDTLETLPQGNPFRENALLLLSSLRSNLEVSSELEEEDRDLIMRLSPLLLDKLEAATQSGIEQGARVERTTIIENLLIMKFNSLDEQLRDIIEPILSLSPEEFSSLLLQLPQLSREELLARFSSEN
ncbi:MAG: flagellar assembly protein H [Okeania sp. SIO3I5]|uniref:flagellar assembly protein H n=1 Tax=Okeania sp. SIO3I5 TaxID=2607805 RepID=UPI0013B6A872|nr:flagellar assembly protein H [Okeania sp. SIO3I5]NEQ36926.1 flagellar assembly protein H [Okeania sp. SIO3I5]